MLITGGSRGIGQALVSHLLPDWNIVFTGRSEAGIGRTLALREGRVTEAVVRVAEVQRVQGWAFLNSLRGWVAAELVYTDLLLKRELIMKHQ